MFKCALKAGQPNNNPKLSVFVKKKSSKIYHTMHLLSLDVSSVNIKANNYWYGVFGEELQEKRLKHLIS